METMTKTSAQIFIEHFNTKNYKDQILSFISEDRKKCKKSLMSAITVDINNKISMLHIGSSEVELHEASGSHSWEDLHDVADRVSDEIIFS